MSGDVEVERKFLVERIPKDLERFPARSIVQGYLAVGADGSEVRLRRRGDATLLTVKRGQGIARREVEVVIGADAFERLWPLTEGARIEKTRYELRADDDLTIELDVYAGALQGLLIAEVEFDGEAAAAGFRPPGWFGREVTEQSAYKNQRLAVDGRPHETDRRLDG
jgi:adenylate cyclase